MNPKLKLNMRIHNEASISIQILCLKSPDKMLYELEMPAPNLHVHESFNRESERERLYGRYALNQLIRTKVPYLNQQQKIAYDTWIEVIDSYREIFFLNSTDRTSKMYIISLILASIHIRIQIALAVTLSSIAATLLEGG